MTDDSLVGTTAARRPLAEAAARTERSPGTKVVSVSGCVRRPGNYEVALGTPSLVVLWVKRADGAKAAR